MADKQPRNVFENLRLEIDPDRIDDTVRKLVDRARRLVEQGRHVKVRLKYKGKPVMKDIPLGVLVATELASFWITGVLSALALNLGVGTILEVEFIHDADEKVEEAKERFMTGDVDEAEDLYRDALALKPGDTAALYHLGVLLRVTGRRDEAMECLKKAAKDEKHPDGERAREALEKMERGPRTL